MTVKNGLSFLVTPQSDVRNRFGAVNYNLYLCWISPNLRLRFRTNNSAFVRISKNFVQLRILKFKEEHLWLFNSIRISWFSHQPDEDVDSKIEAYTDIISDHFSYRLATSNWVECCQARFGSLRNSIKGNVSLSTVDRHGIISIIHVKGNIKTK